MEQLGLMPESPLSSTSGLPSLSPLTGTHLLKYPYIRHSLHTCVTRLFAASQTCAHSKRFDACATR
jgi:hypothetical protein